MVRDDLTKIGEQVEKLCLDAFHFNIKENDKVILVTNLIKHIGDKYEGNPYNKIWNYLHDNFLRADEIRSLDSIKDRVYLLFTQHVHRSDIEVHFLELRKAKQSNVMTTRPQIPTFISDPCQKK